MTNSPFQIRVGVRERQRVEIPQFCYYQLSTAALLLLAFLFCKKKKKKKLLRKELISVKKYYVRNWKIITANTLSSVYSARLF